MEYLKGVREELDKIDSKMIDLFLKRMKISEEVAKIKSENNLPVFDYEREKQKLIHSVEHVNLEEKDDVREFMQFLMDKSKQKQHKILEK